MTKLRTKLIGLFAVLLLLCGILITISACGSTKESYTVTFMVQNESGDWKQVGNAVEVADGTVTLPNDPVKSYYVFLGWYTTSSFEAGTEFKNENISENATVYARFSAKEADVYINGENMGKQTLVDVVNGDYNPGEGLEFDGWYTDSNYTVKYENTDDTSAIYARSVARITYDNGYETVYETTVLPYVAMSQPSSDDIVKFYMDSEDIFFTVDGEDYDWSQPVTESMTINVEWKTPNMVYAENTNSGNLTCCFYGNQASSVVLRNYPEVATYPCVRIPSRVTYNDELRYVDACANTSATTSSWNGSSCASSLKTVIFAEGIKIIKTFEGNNASKSTLEEVVLPSTLVIIEAAFNNFPSLKSVTIPDGVEIIINSFWSDYSTQLNSYSRTDLRSGYDFEIAVPDSVINLSQVPANLTFGENSCFYKDGADRIYKNDERGKVLIADYNVDVNGTLTVEEGVVGIQVGAFFQMATMKYLVLPSTWTFVSYNEDVNNYDYYFYNNTFLQCSLYNPEYKDSFLGNFKINAYAIFDNVSGNYMMGNNVFERVAINHISLPETIYSGSLTGRATYSTTDINVSAYTSESFFGKVTFIGEVPKGENISVNMFTTNIMTGMTAVYTVNLNSGETFTIDDLVNAAGIKGNLSVSSIKQFGDDFELGKAYNTNLYLDITYKYNEGGYTYTTNENGTITVTGFDENSGNLLPSGYFLISIPSEINGVAVTEIAANAFEEVEAISYVFIPSSVTKIGDGAFKNCTNLISVNITAGGLEYVGESAFEGCGFTTIALPLANLTYVGPYAFKSPNFTGFTYADGEAATDKEDYVAGKYYLYGYAKLLVQFVSKSTEQQLTYEAKTTGGSETVDVTVYDVKLIAMPCAFKSLWYGYSLGESSRAYSSNLYDNTRDFVIRYEVMTGSVAYLSAVKLPIIFCNVSYVHANAFTDMDDYYLTYKTTMTTDEDGNTVTNYTSYFRWAEAGYEGQDIYDYWTMKELITSMDSSIFEDGWFDGITEDDERYDDLVFAMEHAALWGSGRAITT